MWMRAHPSRSFFFIEKKGAFLNIFLRDKVFYKAIFRSLLHHCIHQGRCIESHSTLRLTRQVFQARLWYSVIAFPRTFSDPRLPQEHWYGSSVGGEKPERRESSLQPQQKILASLSRLSGKEPGQRAVRQFYLEFSKLKGTLGGTVLAPPPPPEEGGRGMSETLLKPKPLILISVYFQALCHILPELTHWVPLETADLTWF